VKLQKVGGYASIGNAVLLVIVLVIMLVGGVLGIIFYPWLGMALWSNKILPELSTEKT
jgi:hypothetical protein